MAFQEIVCEVPLSRILKISLLPSTGVPVGAFIVNAAACAVRAYWSNDEMSGVMDAVEAVEETLGLMRDVETKPPDTFVAVVAVSALPVVF